MYLNYIINKTIIAGAALVALTLFTTPTEAKTNDGNNNYRHMNFNQAKKDLTAIYAANPNAETIYCGCPIDVTGNKRKHLQPNLQACGYIPNKQPKRAQRIEWEHMMPASWLGKQLQCWQDKGRKGCRGNSDFDIREGDMHNLAPSIGELNAERSAYRYMDLGYKGTTHGSCHFYVSSDSPKAVEPPAKSKGFAARAMLYMSNQYGIRLSKADQITMDRWNKSYPPDSWECKRNMIIKSIQGNDNPFITQSCKNQK